MVQQREEITLLVVSQYLGALRSYADVKAANSRVELAKALYKLATDMQANGVGTSIDTLRANVQFQNEQQRLIAARTELQTSQYGLVKLLNLDPQQPVHLADAATFFQTPVYPAQATIAEAFAQRPELRAVASQIRAVELEKDAARDERLPRVDAGGNWSLAGITPTTMVPTYEYRVGLDMPLFTGGRIKAEIAGAAIQIRKLQQTQQDLKNEIALQVKDALAHLDSARKQVDVANLGARLAQEEVQQARDRFRAGVANNIEVITAQDELARANDNQIAALYSYNQSRADLAHATGQIESMYAH
jgi:outer membrane protein TolC